ncbi:RimK family alpha-L-glutamate ligase [Streptosporangium sp. NPDC087985]|uniref:ATP-grasp domain-containing protein n=1 Tax=Streptosporangium sp. NPDC087985 TaxID=3366196 RepID=UPI003804AE2F
MGASVAYVTFADPDGVDDEKEIALAAWAEVGIAGQIVRWDDPEVDWAAFDAVVVRSPWDYIDRRAEFLGWVRRVDSVTRLLNPAAVLERNTDKTYLRDLKAPAIATYWVAPGEAVDFPVLDEYVVKPSVSSGARDTIRTRDRKEAEAHAARLAAEGRTAMIQPYLDMVEAEGETSLLYFGGRFSHAVRRPPMLAGEVTAPDEENGRGELRTPELGQHLPRTPEPDQFALAERVLAEFPELLYARVDLVRLSDGTPVLIELELTEPYLFLRWAPDAAANLARALAEAI